MNFQKFFGIAFLQYRSILNDGYALVSYLVLYAIFYLKRERNPERYFKTYTYKQKQPLEVCCKKRYSAKFLKFYKKTTVVESLINKAEYLQACNFIKKRLQHRFFTVNMIHADIGCSKKLSLRGLLSTQCQSISKMEVFPKILHLMKPLTFSPRSSI